MREVGLYLICLPRSFYLLGAATLVVVLFWGGSQPFAAGLVPVPYDKLAHSLYFGVLSMMLWFGTGGRWPLLLVVAVSAIGGYWMNCIRGHCRDASRTFPTFCLMRWQRV